MKRIGKGLLLFAICLCMAGVFAPITARAADSIKLDRSSIFFSNNSALKKPYQTITIENTGTDTIELKVSLNRETKSGIFKLDVNDIFSLASGEKKIVTVAVDMDEIDVGKYYADINVRHMLGSNMGSVLKSAGVELWIYPEEPTVIWKNIGKTVCKKGEITTLEVSASVSDGGILSYEWYKVDGDISSSVGCTSSSFTPPTTDVGQTKYYCKVTNTKNGISNYKDSEKIIVTVTGDENKDPSNAGGNTGSTTPNTGGNTSGTVSSGSGSNTASLGSADDQAVEEEQSVREVSYGGFLEDSSEEIRNVSSGDTLTIDGGVWHTLSRDVMLALSKRRDITFVFTCRYKNKTYCIEIPAGAVIDTKEPYYGPLYLIQLYGLKE